MKYYREYNAELYATRPFYYNNDELCGECTGAGCKHCYDPLGLRRLGGEIFPVSVIINGARPPAIAQSYASKFSQFSLPRYYGVIPVSQRLR
jgi:hypothetical protein